MSKFLYSHNIDLIIWWWNIRLTSNMRLWMNPTQLRLLPYRILHPQPLPFSQLIGSLNVMAFISYWKIRLVFKLQFVYYISSLMMYAYLGWRNQRITATCGETQEENDWTRGNDRCSLGACFESILFFLNVHATHIFFNDFIVNILPLFIIIFILKQKYNHNKLSLIKS